jgi:hypothetical protein
MRDRRGRQLQVAVWFLELRPAPADAALAALRSWMDSWAGIGAVTAGMAYQGYDLQLTRYDARGWRATFYASGMEHSITGAIGSAFEPSPWRATQRAALQALGQVIA